MARDADLFVVPVAEYGAVRVVDGVLEVGPSASPDAIATVALRRQLAMAGEKDEAAVRELVEGFGYRYVPERVRLLRDLASGVAYRAVS